MASKTKTPRLSSSTRFTHKRQEAAAEGSGGTDTRALPAPRCRPPGPPRRAVQRAGVSARDKAPKVQQKQTNRSGGRAEGSRDQSERETTRSARRGSPAAPGAQPQPAGPRPPHGPRGRARPTGVCPARCRRCPSKAPAHRAGGGATHGARPALPAPSRPPTLTSPLARPRCRTAPRRSPPLAASRAAPLGGPGREGRDAATGAGRAQSALSSPALPHLLPSPAPPPLPPGEASALQGAARTSSRRRRRVSAARRRVRRAPRWGGRGGSAPSPRGASRAELPVRARPPAAPCAWLFLPRRGGGRREVWRGGVLGCEGAGEAAAGPGRAGGGGGRTPLPTF